MVQKLLHIHGYYVGPVARYWVNPHTRKITVKEKNE